MQPNQQKQNLQLTQQSQENLQKQWNNVEEYAMEQLKQIIQPCVIPEQLIQHELQIRGFNIQDQQLLQIVALGLQQQYCKILERVQIDNQETTTMTGKNLIRAIGLSGNKKIAKETINALLE